MKKIRIIAAVVLSLIIVSNIDLHTLAASSELRRVDYFEAENYTIWGEVDDDGILYVIMLYSNGDMYVSRTDTRAENIAVYGLTISKDEIDTSFFLTKNHYNYWNKLREVAKNNEDKFSLVTGITLSDNNARATTAETLMLNYVKSQGNSIQTNSYLYTDRTSFPGTTIKVSQNRSISSQQYSIVNVVRTQNIADAVSFVCGHIQQLFVVSVVAYVISMVCSDIIDTYGKFTENGALTPVCGTAITTRFCTVNGGNVTYSEATKKVVYAGMYRSATGAMNAQLHDTQYTPSEYSFGDSNTYWWLISTAYNNYT